MKYIIFAILTFILSFMVFFCFRKIYRFINPPKCSYRMFVIDVGTM